MLKLYEQHRWLHSVRSMLTIGALVIAILSAFLLDRPARAGVIPFGSATETSLPAAGRLDLASLTHMPRASSANSPKPGRTVLFAAYMLVLLTLSRRVF